MSPVEFSLVSRWYVQGIPLRIVLRGMQDTKGRDAATLAYYGPSVAEAAERWRRAVPPVQDQAGDLSAAERYEAWKAENPPEKRAANLAAMRGEKP